MHKIMFDKVSKLLGLEDLRNEIAPPENGWFDAAQTRFYKHLHTLLITKSVGRELTDIEKRAVDMNNFQNVANVLGKNMLVSWKRLALIGRHGITPRFIEHHKIFCAKLTEEDKQFGRDHATLMRNLTVRAHKHFEEHKR